MATRPELIRLSTLVYAAMALIGALVSHFGHHNLHALLAIPTNVHDTARLFLIGGLGAGLLLIVSYFFEQASPSYRELKRAVMALFGASGTFAAIYLALISAFGEELLFRGAIQPYAGLVLTSVIFGLLHLSPQGSISSWSVWAIVAGLLMGWTVLETASLWPAITTHFMVNATSIVSLQRDYRKERRERSLTPLAEQKDDSQ